MTITEKRFTSTELKQHIASADEAMAGLLLRYAELLKKEKKVSALAEELATIQKGIRRYTRFLEIATEDESASGMREAMKHTDSCFVPAAVGQRGQRKRKRR
jgi:hypothetical protein